MSLSKVYKEQGIPECALAMKTTIKPQPLAPAASIVQGDKWRITVLTDGLIRFEWSETGKFEDRASMFAVHRNQPTPKFEVVERENQIEIVTDRVHVEYDRNAFSASGLTATLRADAKYYNIIWRYGQEMSNLGGTTRTLDFIDGRTALWDGVLSKDGIAVVEDSEATLFESNGWVGERTPGNIDFYLFTYAKDYRAALNALHNVSGHAPIIPRWALGNWWSRYYPYSQDEYIGLMDKFKKDDIPLSVAVIDMDWHLVDVPEKAGSGWTGWTWNKALFPDHVQFLKDLHDRGLHTTLNTHPADGVRSYEKIYPEMCKALGRDPKEGLPIAWDPSDRKTTDAYFGILHRSLEEEGCDFWWPDYQGPPISGKEGLDPYWLLIHYHFMDSARDGKRPMGFTRYGGPGGQRYPIGFSGDTVITWDSLSNQPEFTATASNIGYGWWSHDIGGHHQGYKDDELNARWVQVGLWSPVLRLHCTTGPFYTREPWRYNDESREAASRALRFRHRLVPYIYTMAVRNAVDGRCLVEPMYYDNPNEELAYNFRKTFKYGTQLIAAPVTTPRQKVTTFAKTDVWLPEGRYVDIFTSRVYDGGRVIAVHRPLDKVPVFAKEGAIVPLDSANSLENGCPLPEKMEILLVVGADGQFELVEDDGSGASVDQIAFSRTLIKYTQADGKLTIGADGKPLVAQRDWSIRLLAYTPNFDQVKVTSGGKSINIAWSNDYAPSDPNGWLLELGKLDSTKEIAVHLGAKSPQLDIAPLKSAAFIVIDAAQIENNIKDALWEVVKSEGTVPLTVLMSRLAAVDCDPKVHEALMEVILADSREYV